MGILVLVRHGQSQWNLENRFTGWVDVDLSDQGIEEAKTAGQLIKNEKIDFHKAHTSRLKRASKTLDFILKEIHQNPTIWCDSALNERHYGQLQGLDKDETRAKYGDEQVRIWRRSYDVAPPGGECLADTAKRALPYFREYILKSVSQGENILVVAHGNSLRSVIMEIQKMTPQEILQFEIDTGRPYLYEVGLNGEILNSKEL
jgi:2,3-bisphosphoglycerate-dependent phosphoglycerate mutase